MLLLDLCFSHHHFRARLQLRVIILKDKTEEKNLYRSREWIPSRGCSFVCCFNWEIMILFCNFLARAWSWKLNYFFSKNTKQKRRKKNLFYSSKTIMLIYLKHYAECIVSFFLAHEPKYSDELAKLVEGRKMQTTTCVSCSSVEL